MAVLALAYLLEKTLRICIKYRFLTRYIRHKDNRQPFKSSLKKWNGTIAGSSSGFESHFAFWLQWTVNPLIYRKRQHDECKRKGGLRIEGYRKRFTDSSIQFPQFSVLFPFLKHLNYAI
ncbi:MAG: hypothetical protein CR968_00175 [Flavobacteriia bacterium]|nr:MAG: hypothetical protein CR968_00175 [Flavobacteriia bacterium]